MVAEEKLEVETPFGPVWFWRRDTGQPVLLLITGTLAEPAVLRGLDDVLQGIDLWRVHLPGNHCPPLATTSVGMFAAAFTEAIRTALQDRPVVVAGLSVGGLAALGIRAPNVRRLLVVEPPLLTEGVWVLEVLRDQAPPGHEDFLWQVLGIGPDRIEPRDYTGLLAALRLPTLALVGGVSGPRDPDFEVMPSMMTPASRALLDRHPHVNVVEAPGAGHNVPARATMIFLRAIEATCREAFGPQVELVL